MIDAESSGKIMQNDSKIATVLLADDHPVVRQALKNELEKEPGFKVVAEAADGEEAVKLARELRPEVVVMDIGMPKLNGIQATRQIKMISPETLVMVLTIYDDVEHVFAIFESGADGYLTKGVLVKDIVQAIRSLIAREAVLSSHIFQQILKYALRPGIKPVVHNSGIKLTVRELEILKLLAMGMSNKQIAEDLNIGIRTVKSHLVDIFSKLQVFSRTEAVITGLRAGFIELDDLC